MTEHRQNRSQLWSLSIVTSVATHILVVCLWLLYLYWKAKDEPKLVEVKPPPPPEEVLHIKLLPTIEVEPADPELSEQAELTSSSPSNILEEFQEPEPEPDKSSFSDTHKDDESKPSRETNRFGATDNSASSNTNLDKKAPERVAQAGEKPKYPGLNEFIDRKYQDGEIDRPPSEAGQSAPDKPESDPLLNEQQDSPAENDKNEDSVDPEQIGAPESPDSEELNESQDTKEAQGADSVDLTTPVVPDESFREREQSLKVAVPSPLPPQPLPEKIKQEQPKESLPPQKKRSSQSQIQDPAFKRSTQANHLSGSIGLRSNKISQDVESTPKGKYFSEVHDLVAKIWIKKCRAGRDNLVPGVLRASFLVSPEGKVYNIRFSQAFEGGAIQKGYTLHAINTAKIPKMNQEVMDELDGEPLEMMLNFIF